MKLIRSGRARSRRQPGRRAVAPPGTCGFEGGRAAIPDCSFGNTPSHTLFGLPRLQRAARHARQPDDRQPAKNVTPEASWPIASLSAQTFSNLEWNARHDFASYTASRSVEPEGRSALTSAPRLLSYARGIAPRVWPGGVATCGSPFTAGGG
jgi:hypothetical protein